MPELTDAQVFGKKELSNAEVFGSTPSKELSDAEVFGSRTSTQPATHVDEYGNRITRGKEIPDPRAGRSFFENLKNDLPSAGEFFSDLEEPFKVPLTKITEDSIQHGMFGKTLAESYQDFSDVVKDVATTGTVQGTPSQRPGAAAQVASGLTKAGVGVGETLISPIAVATASAGALPAWGQRLIQLGFTADMLRSTPELARAFGEASVSGTKEEQVKSLADLMINSGFVVGAAKHGLTPAKTAEVNALAKQMLQQVEGASPDTAGANEAARRATIPAPLPSRSRLSPVEQVPEGAPGSPFTSRLAPIVPRETVTQTTLEEQPVTAEVKAAEAVVPTPIESFVQGVTTGQIKTTEAARNFGNTVKTAGEIMQLRQAYDLATTQARAALKVFSDPNATPEQQQAASNAGFIPQFINEAIEAATGAYDVKMTDAKRYAELMKAAQPKAVAPTTASEQEVLETLEGTGDLSAKQKKRLKELRATASNNLPDWARDEMTARGLDPARPLNDVDVQNPSVVQAVQADPTLTDAQKKNILATGSSKEATGKDAGAVAVDAGGNPVEAAAAPVVQEESPKVKLMKMGLTAKQAGDVATGRRKLEEFVQPPRILDTKGSDKFGASYDDRIGEVDPVEKAGDDAFLKRVLDGRGTDAKDPSKSKRTLVVLNKETGEMRELSVWENNGNKIVDPDKKNSSKDPMKLLRTFSKREGVTLKWAPVASLRYEDFQKGINHPVTSEELAQLKAEHGQAVGDVATAKAVVSSIDSEGGVSRDVVDPSAAAPQPEPLSELESWLRAKLQDKKTKKLNPISPEGAVNLADEFALGEPESYRGVVGEYVGELAKSAEFMALSRADKAEAVRNQFASRIYEFVARQYRRQEGIVEDNQRGDGPTAAGELSTTEQAPASATEAVHAEKPTGSGEATKVTPELLKEAGYKSEKSFRKDFEKNRIAEVEETESEFMRRRFCSDTIPKTRVRATE